MEQRREPDEDHDGLDGAEHMVVNAGRTGHPERRVEPRGLWVALAFAVYLPNMLGHRQANEFVDRMWRGLSMVRYQTIAFHTALAAGAVALVVFGLLVATSAAPKRWAVTVAVAFVAVWACHTLLIVNHVEVIHFAQYGAIGALLALGLRNPTAALIAGTALGIIDEGWQYYVLYADFPDRSKLYLDGNDMVLNLVGTALGVIAVLVARDRRRLIPRR
jgi:VanZ family protein